MHYALSASSRELIRRFAGPDTLLAFDFDGTLAPIVSQPDRARLRPVTRMLLRRLAEHHTCLVLSGRSRNDLRHMLDGTGIRHLIGNHGAEPWEGARQVRRQVDHWQQVLAAELPDLAGLWVENKTFSLTAHYRQCSAKRAARAWIAEVARSLKGARLVEGKESVSIVSRSAPHKGTALKTAMTRLKFDRALYVGDDETDEDAFAAGSKTRPVFSIRVSRKKDSAATHFLRNQHEIDDLLRQILGASRGR